jgi:hypothetical protein
MAGRGKAAIKSETPDRIVIKAPNFEVVELGIRGDAQLVSNNFSQEAIDQMKVEQEKGSQAKGKKSRERKDFEAGYQGSMHISEEGWAGIPATAFRAAMIRACSTCGIEMTKAKMCFFILADGYERLRGTPLVKILQREPERFDAYVRNSNGSADIRARARWTRGWECVLRVRFDKDLFSAETVANLVERAGISVGVGAGRPFSTMSAGQGWGTFNVISSPEGDVAPAPASASTKVA